MAWRKDRALREINRLSWRDRHPAIEKARSFSLNCPRKFYRIPCAATGRRNKFHRRLGTSVVVLSVPLAAITMPAFATLVMGAPMAGNAVGEVLDAFTDMFGADIGFGMLMAAIAGVLPPIARGMAGRAGSIVIPVEHKEARMIECRGLPVALAVALRALGDCTTVDRRFRRNMARAAILPYRRIEQRVGEAGSSDRRQRRIRVIGMTGHAVLGCQALMKWRDGGWPRGGWPGDRRPLCRAQSDISNLVARDASLRRGASQRCVTSKAVGLEACMAGNQWSRRHHEMRIEKDQCGEPDEIGRDDKQDPAFAHRHPQNRKMLMMWPRARTAKASAIG